MVCGMAWSIVRATITGKIANMKANRFVSPYLVVALTLFFLAPAAQAVPSFARQTGMACSACHTVFPELTPFGREFKLNGYVIDNMKEVKAIDSENRQTLSISSTPPIAAMLQVSYTHTKEPLPDSAVVGANAKNGEVLFPQQASLFYAGKIAENLGAFVQLTYDGAEDHFGFDNADIRFARYLATREPGPAGSDKSDSQSWSKRHDLIFGVTINNNPTVQDPWNTTAAWGLPYSASSVAPGLNASAKLDSGAGGIGQDAGGIGAYVWVDHSIYAELSLYTAVKNGGAHPLDSTQAGVIQGLAPYWRFGYEHRWDRNSLFVGTYGSRFDILPGDGLPLSGESDRYTDMAVDAQYQYVGEQHLVTLLATYIHENQDLQAGVVTGAAAQVKNDLRTIKLAAEYSYKRLIGGTLGIFNTTGSSDVNLYADTGDVNGSINGSPDGRGFLLEANYLPWLNTKLQLQFVHYSKFNGLSTDYAGIGRNASDNDTLYLSVWLNW